MLTGKPKEKSQVLRTKVNAVHAGLSLPQLPWKVVFSLADQTNFYQNNNLLTVQEAMEIKAAMEDGWIQLSNMLLITVLQLKTVIHMLQETKLAKLMVAQLKSKDLLMFPAVIIWLMLSVEDQSQLLSMLEIGVFTEVESCQTAQPTLITEFFSLDTVTNSGKLKIHGEQDGEKVDILELPEEILALFAVIHLIQHSEFNDSQHNQFNK